MMPWSFQVFLAVVVLLAAVFDLRFRRIPNWLVAITLVWGLAMNGFLFGGEGLTVSLLGIALAMAVYFPMFLLRAMGAGDVKLMMAIGSLVGPGNWFLIFLCTGILGGVFGTALLLWRKKLGETLARSAFIVTQLSRLKAPYHANAELDVNNPKSVTMPHGATIAAGALAFLAGAHLFGAI